MPLNAERNAQLRSLVLGERMGEVVEMTPIRIRAFKLRSGLGHGDKAELTIQLRPEVPVQKDHVSSFPERQYRSASFLSIPPCRQKLALVMFITLKNTGRGQGRQAETGKMEQVGQKNAGPDSNNGKMRTLRRPACTSCQKKKDSQRNAFTDQNGVDTQSTLSEFTPSFSANSDSLDTDYSQFVQDFDATVASTDFSQQAFDFYGESNTADTYAGSSSSVPYYPTSYQYLNSQTDPLAWQAQGYSATEETDTDWQYYQDPTNSSYS
ncbi:hypothetical protein V8F20_009558 [Naviculisporaceae sp. PSN 640]